MKMIVCGRAAFRNPLFASSLLFEAICAAPICAPREKELSFHSCARRRQCFVRERRASSREEEAGGCTIWARCQQKASAQKRERREIQIAGPSAYRGASSRDTSRKKRETASHRRDRKEDYP
ncbi:hypothetical protein MRX96_034738 [Rhipicephalus microplus]